jgi:hypothetical protein
MHPPDPGEERLFCIKAFPGQAETISMAGFPELVAKIKNM